MTASDGHLHFSADPADSFAVAGLPAADPVVYRIGGDGVVRLDKLEVKGKPGDYTVTFAGDDAPAEYVVATASAYLTPAIEPAPPLEDITSGDAEYLVISHPDFLDGLQPLVTLKREQGLVVKVVDVTQIYEHYSGGVVDPDAIRDFVVFSARESHTRFVLLVGGDSYDYKDYLGLGAVSFIPSLYVQTGEIVKFAPADVLYGDLDGDRIPEIPVGRWPVRTDAELAAIVAKTEAYEQKDYRRTVLSATDAYDINQRLSFVDTSADLLSVLGDDWQVEHADIDVLGLAAARSKVIEGFNQGVAIAQYFGHSSFNIWSFQVLFAGSWVHLLENAGRPAVVAQWGCWNTYYVSPTANTLGHALMLQGEHGAAAVLGAATLTDSGSDVALGREYLARMTQPGVTLGEALVAAKRALAAEHPEMMDVVVGWSILGDPALVVEPEQP